MSDILPDLLVHDCFYWAPGTNPDKFGEYTAQDPVSRKCRWSTKRKVLKGPNNNDLEINETIFLKEEVVKEGWLLKKTTSDEEAPDSPPKEYQIKQVDVIDDTEGSETLWKAYI